MASAVLLRVVAVALHQQRAAHEQLAVVGEARPRTPAIGTPTVPMRFASGSGWTVDAARRTRTMPHTSQHRKAQARARIRALSGSIAGRTGGGEAHPVQPEPWRGPRAQHDAIGDRVLRRQATRGTGLAVRTSGGPLARPTSIAHGRQPPPDHRSTSRPPAVVSMRGLDLVPDSAALRAEERRAERRAAPSDRSA